MDERIADNTDRGLRRRLALDPLFLTLMAVVGGFYVLMIALLLGADVLYLIVGPADIAGGGGGGGSVLASLLTPEIQYSIKLSLISCTITAILSIWVAVPVAYLLSRYRVPFKGVIDAALDIPIVLPPLVVGLSLLILFRFMPAGLREAVVYELPSVILAQFMVAAAFAVRVMRATFDQLDTRREQVALTLGCSRAQAFGLVVLPEARRGIITAGTLAWARALGEFGPLLVFAGATRNKTEVLSTTVFLELGLAHLKAAVAVSLLMVVVAVVVLVVARLFGTRALEL